MATATNSVLKTYFNTGDKPTQQNFFDLLESNLNLTDGGVMGAAAVVTGLEQYVKSAAISQVVGTATDLTTLNLTQPAGTVLTDIGVVCTTATVGSANIIIRVGTADDGEQICVDKNFCSSGVVAIGQSMSVMNGTQGEGAQSLAFVAAAPYYSAASRTIHIRSQISAAVTAGTFVSYIKFMKIV
tara:strand:+ start:2213 stop:2767 length:555 start_codon:yes stop_codon:yes gene_type:complete